MSSSLTPITTPYTAVAVATGLCTVMFDYEREQRKVPGTRHGKQFRVPLPTSPSYGDYHADIMQHGEETPGLKCFLPQRDIVLGTEVVTEMPIDDVFDHIFPGYTSWADGWAKFSDCALVCFAMFVARLPIATGSFRVVNRLSDNDVDQSMLVRWADRDMRRFLPIETRFHPKRKVKENRHARVTATPATPATSASVTSQNASSSVPPTSPNAAQSSGPDHLSTEPSSSHAASESASPCTEESQAEAVTDEQGQSGDDHDSGLIPLAKKRTRDDSDSESEVEIETNEVHVPKKLRSEETAES